ncbi:restriction endonuclease subunit S [Pseudomonas kuykendallii]|uniref:restriction endonuclease subunit S n=1 Tax=Pseudomonas kuykendallii TaxID=1007099 RepID=UPI0028D1E92F|nr:restriction endonuclease subunit S [Pseudomonas kuykendallii]
MSLPAYPAYIDVGVDWLGKIPAHWQQKWLGLLAAESRTAFVDGPFGSDLKSSDYQDEGIPLIQLNNIRDGQHVLRNMKFISEEKRNELSRHSAFPGDVVIAKMADPVARSAIVSEEFSEYVIVADCVKMTPNLTSVDLGFLIWAVNSDCVRISAELMSSGVTRIRINLGQVKKLKIPYPPLCEQTQIARFLDHETARIDALIEEQQRLIELLKEKRQAVISHAVTKGLDPKVPMKDSGVEWLGEVPAHWDVMALKWRARIKSGDGISPSLIEAELSTQNSIPVIGGNGVMGYTSQGNITPPIIVIGRVGALCGNVHKIYEPAWVSDNALVLEVQRESLDLAYLAHVLNARNLNQMADKSAQPLITGSKVTSQCLPCPCLDEQRAIAAFVDSVLAEFDELTLAGEEGIELLKERRSALISAAVTGKIDVRGWQPPASTQAPKLEVAEAV